MPTTKIPILDLKREYALLKKDIEREIKNCISSQQWILGEKLSQFEKTVAKYLDANYAVGVASGTDALLLSLRVLGIELKNKEFFDKKEEIITTPFTFVATAEAIIRSGATPVFVDINPSTFTIDPSEIEKAITKNTVGIMPVHLYGLASDMGGIGKIAKKYRLFVVEDVAQAFGGMYKNKKLGTLGDCGAFSFFPSKNLGGWGDGGVVVTDSLQLADKIKILRNHGQKEKYDAFHIGYNSRLDSLQAAVLLAKLKYVDKWNSLRRAAAGKYEEGLKDIGEIELPVEPENHFHVYNLYTIKVPSLLRNKLKDYLNLKGIDARVYYPQPLYKMEAFKNRSKTYSIKATEDILSKILSVPINPFLEDREISCIIKAVRKFFGR